MGGSTTTIEPDIPKTARPYWEKFAKQVEGMVGNIPTYGRYQGPAAERYTGPATQRYAGAFAQPYANPFTAWMSPQETAGLQGIQSWAQQPGQLEDVGRGLLAGTMQGEYLKPESNPFLRQMSEAMMGNMSDAIAAGSEGLGDIFSKAGVSYRGPAEQKMRQGALSDFSNAMTNLYGNTYESERNRQMSALPMAQSWAQMPYQRASSLMQAGTLPRQLQQGNLDKQYAEFLRYGGLDYDQSTRLGQQDYADWLRFAGQDYNDWLRNISEQKEAFYKPYDLMSGLLGQMPLAYPQQQYNKGPLDYAVDLAPYAMLAFM